MISPRKSILLSLLLLLTFSSFHLHAQEVVFSEIYDYSSVLGEADLDILSIDFKETESGFFSLVRGKYFGETELVYTFLGVRLNSAGELEEILPIDLIPYDFSTRMFMLPISDGLLFVTSESEDSAISHTLIKTDNSINQEWEIDLMGFQNIAEIFRLESGETFIAGSNQNNQAHLVQVDELGNIIHEQSYEIPLNELEAWGEFESASFGFIELVAEDDESFTVSMNLTGSVYWGPHAGVGLAKVSKSDLEPIELYAVDMVQPNPSDLQEFVRKPIPLSGGREAYYTGYTSDGGNAYSLVKSYNGQEVWSLALGSGYWKTIATRELCDKVLLSVLHQNEEGSPFENSKIILVDENGLQFSELEFVPSENFSEGEIFGSILNENNELIVAAAASNPGSFESGLWFLKYSDIYACQDIPIGVDEILEPTALTVYQSGHTLNIECSDVRCENFNLMNTSGKTFLSGQFSSGMELNVSGMPSGLYHLQLLSDQFEVLKKTSVFIK